MADAPIAVLGAMTSEVRLLVENMRVEREERRAGVLIWQGGLFGRPAIVARTGMGKVSAAAGAQSVIDRFGARPLVVCGLAGGIGGGLRVGDVVVATACVHHDMDASPIFPRFEVPGLGRSAFPAPEGLVSKAVAAAEAFLAGHFAEDVPAEARQAFGIEKPRVVAGLVATGDQFVGHDRRQALLSDLPEALCVEMEGAAIAQVCYLNETEFAIIRTISDNADAAAAVDFGRFVESIAPQYTVGIVRELFRRL